MRNKAGLIWLCCGVLLALAWPAWAQDALPARLQQADRLLAQAEGDRANAATNVRQAATLVPEKMTPAVQQAARTPDRQHLARARQEVAALRQVIAIPRVEPYTAPAPASARDARTQLERVLAGGEYQTLKKTQWRLPGWLEAVRRGIGSVFAAFGRGWKSFWRGVGRTFHHLFGRWETKPPSGKKSNWLSALGANLRYIVFAVLIAAVLFLLGLLISRLLAWHRRQEAPPAREGLLEREPAVTRKGEPSYWERALAQAQAYWQAGDEREALRTLYRACLILLDARGVLRYDETRANGEVLRELRRQGRGPVHDALRPVVRTFDKSWYGFLRVPTEEFDQVLDSSRRFRDTVTTGEK